MNPLMPVMPVSNLLTFRTTNSQIFTKSGVVIALLGVFTASNAQQNIYAVPPSTAVESSVAFISDAAMQDCVKLYNQAIWLKQQIYAIEVDLRSPASVDAYNAKASMYSDMADNFNAQCAGKQAKFAVNAVEKLNQSKN